jgi:hypothetical protein
MNFSKKILLFLLLLPLPLDASEIGHFFPAVLRPRDVTMPAPGTYFVDYNTYYSASTYKDRNGDEADTVTIGGVPVNIDVNVNSFMFTPGVLHTTNWEIFGARYGFFLLQPFGNLSVGAALNTLTGQGLSAEDSSFGIGDTFVQPLWLGWDMRQSQVALGYGFYAPTGKYDSGSPSNVGLGFWTHQFQAAGTFYLDPRERTAFTSSLSYELHGEKDGVDVTPGDDITLTFGADHEFVIRKKWLGNIGLSFYGQWQIFSDTGSTATSDALDQVYGAGLNAGLTYVPWLGQIDFHWMHEFEAIDRLEGDFYTLTLAIPL